MPRYSDDTLLQRAINSAMLDRESFAEAYGHTGPVAMEAKALESAFSELRGKKLQRMSVRELETARLCFIYAEQWETSLADATGASDKAVFAKSIKDAALFKEVRTRRWGRTDFEVRMSGSQAIPIQDLLKTLYVQEPGAGTPVNHNPLPAALAPDAASPTARSPAAPRRRS